MNDFVFSSEFWNWWVILLTVGNVLACWWLIAWTSKKQTGEAASGAVTGHTWDETLQEYNNPLPRWWLWLFHITLVFGLVYLAFYPGSRRAPPSPRTDGIRARFYPRPPPAAGGGVGAMTLVTLALAALVLAPAPAAPAKAVPMTVEVRTAPKAGADVESWAKELRAALGARKEEFRLAKAGETAEFVVQLDSIGKRPDGTPVLNGSFALGKAAPRPFNYGFTDVRTEAERLARNLRGYADQMKAATAR